ncbi:TadE/TadG family type IV pilus assembly protein [Streptomyces gamaensis]|uniref:TadE/TadG family type IV pilus assembly protein n=1 Tax=Streptomyces gamaensis TaxID=1763542 RepID=A0ABW0YTW6_9ACTN
MKGGARGTAAARPGDRGWLAGRCRSAVSGAGGGLPPGWDGLVAVAGRGDGRRPERGSGVGAVFVGFGGWGRERGLGARVVPAARALFPGASERPRPGVGVAGVRGRRPACGRGSGAGPVSGGGRSAAGGRGRGARAAAPGRRARRQRGSASVELLGFLPVLMLVGLAAVQLGLVAYAAQQAGSAARAAARTASLDDPRLTPGEAGRAALSGWLELDGADAPSCDGAARTTATVSVRVPSVVPLLGGPTVTRSATMPCPAGPRAGDRGVRR